MRVKHADGTYYRYPWAGGMNSCQYGSVDLDMDGIKDLVVFDRVGNRILPFINAGISGAINFEYAPSYVSVFPELFDWMILADYDCDGREDIFTYSPGYAGMKVYHNNSSSSLSFELAVSPYLTSFQGGGYVNILVTYADYPGIADLDGDGDLDILTFWGLGAFVEMHKNLSMEKYGSCDSLDYEKTGLCWGYFAESEESNELFLDTCIGWVEDELLPHTGSTFQVLDLNGDHVMDVLLGDVDYPALIALNNTGTRDSAYIGSYISGYPDYSLPVELYSMPAAAYLDVDNDGLKDLLVSPFDPNPFIGENKTSSWAYLDKGTDGVPYFEFLQDDFLQGQMIDVGAGCYPVIEDYNNDGLPDLFIGNYGYYDSSWYDEYMILHTELTGKIALFQNIGTSSIPEFTFVTDDFSNLSDLGKKGLMPTFGDLDGDGDKDMLTGSEDGNVCLYENTAGQGEPMNLQLISTHFQDIDVGDYSTVQLFDLDKDGTRDLIIGEKSGKLNYYKGSPGTVWMEFSPVTDYLGQINVTDPDLSLDGYSVPCFFKDNEGNTLLLVGSEQGKLFFYNHIDGNLEGAFTESDTLGQMLGINGFNADRGYRTAGCIADLDHDGWLDLLAGNFSGGLELLSLMNPPAVSGITETGRDEGIEVFPNPARELVTVKTGKNYPGSISKVELFTVSGRCVYAEDIEPTGRVNISLSGIPGGVYLVRVTTLSSKIHLSYFNKKLIIFN